MQMYIEIVETANIGWNRNNLDDDVSDNVVDVNEEKVLLRPFKSHSDFQTSPSTRGRGHSDFQTPVSTRGRGH